MTALTGVNGNGVNGNQVQLPAGSSDLTWNFAAEPEFGGPEFEPNVDLIVRHPNGTPISGGSLRLGIGNDPPVVLLVEPMPTDPADPSESSGNVEVRLGVSDSSSDVVAIDVEWRRTSDAPGVWQPATAAGVFPGGVETDPAGVTLSFFWNTNVDLADGDDDVLLRVTADDGTLALNGDPIGISAPLESALLHVDNNAEPIVQLLNDAVISNPDELRGIPVPVRVIDEEGDLVQLVMQWRREGEAFPDLPADVAGLDALLADPAQRREKHVCTEFPHYAQGKTVPLDASSVRLPELATSEAWALAYGLASQALELLRPSSIPAPITPTWSTNPLAGPVAALPVGDGLSALVLDAPGSSWRLREIELATGAVLPTAGSILASGPGAPSALAMERGGRAVLVASDVAGTWRLERVERASGAVTELAVSDGSEPGPVRGLASRGRTTVLLTVGSSLYQIDYGNPLAPRLAPLLRGLAAPAGVVIDPLAPNRCFVSERGANRILAFDLDSHDRTPVAVKTAGQAGELVEPGALVFEGTGPRLLVVTGVPGGGEQLMGIDLGAQGGNAAFAIGSPQASGIAGVASGPDGLRLAAVPGENELLVAGGIEQRRTILALDPQALRVQRAVVDPPFDPQPVPNQPWRIALGTLVHASPQGVVARFVWDSTEAHTGSVFLRAMGRDDERGPPAEAAATKRVRHALEIEPQLLGDSSQTSYSAVGDLDGDGDEDIVLVRAGGSDGDRLNIFFQEEPESFRSPPLEVNGPGVLFNVGFVALGDLDGDHDLDIAVTSYDGESPTLFFQEASGSFGPPQTLPGRAHILAIGDLDGDGDQDILATSDLETAIFFQESPGVFGVPQAIGAPARSLFARSVAVADLDCDGDLDALSMLAAGPTIFFQEMPGSFGSPQLIGDPFSVFFPTSVAVGDLDGDGDQDILSHSSSTEGLAVYFQQAKGSYSLPIELTTAFSSQLMIGDLDGDGDQDFSSGETAFFQDAPGVFAREPAGLLPARSAAFSAALGDLNGDGATDLVATDGSATFLCFQAEPGSFGPPERPTQTFSVDVAIGDMDGDGDQDFVSALNDISVLLQGSPRSFGAPPIVLEGTQGGFQFDRVVSGDLDGDGDRDLVSTNFLESTLNVFLQTEPGRFGPPLGLGGPGLTDAPRGVAIGDLDGDGDQELVAAGALGLTVFLREANGAWTHFILSVPDGAGSIAIADLDGDGYQDLVTSTGFPSASQAVFFQQPPLGFGPTPLLLAGAAGSTAIGDMNGDGQQDIVAVTSPEHVRIRFQGPPRRFDGPSLVLGGSPATFGLRDIAISDLDGDGDRDIVAVQQGGATGSGDAAPGLVAFFQGAPGTFGPARVLANAGTTSGTFFFVEVTDLDGDGELDIIGGVSVDSVLWGGR
ncbi:MAG: VCBS repeat-containing protein [Planctomycetes bacterium]|nr:VCBS repeat-containing protein [Planctomycetota bacterium]